MTLLNRPLHGGRTQSGAAILHDLSTNANSLGPCPSILASLREADLTQYPDYEYTELRERLGRVHRVSPEQIVVGPGASELILRLVRRHDGPVRVLGPTFSEYARCARLEGRPVTESHDASAWAAVQRQDGGLGFACWPNNPTGELWPLATLAEASRRGLVVVDLAYADLCGDLISVQAEQQLRQAIRLYSPNKAFGLTGVRGAYLVLPAPDEQLQWLGASWCVDALGCVLLQEAQSPAARVWLADRAPILQERRRQLASALRGEGMAVLESPANFLLAQTGDPLRTRRALAGVGVQARDASSFGLPGWFRFAAPREEAVLGLIVDTLAELGELAQSPVSGAVSLESRP